MALRDLKPNLDVVQALAPAARTATVNGTGVDLRGYDAAMVVFHPGTITDGTHTPSVEESDDNSTFTAVAAADLAGTLANLASNTIQRVGYRGVKRYIRPRVVVSGATTGGVYGAEVVRGYPALRPV